MSPRHLPVDVTAAIVAAQLVDGAGLTRARSIAKAEGVGVLCALVRNGLVDATRLAAFVATTLGMPIRDLDTPAAAGRGAPALPELLCRRHRVLTLGVVKSKGRELVELAMIDPSDAVAMARVQDFLAMAVRPILVDDRAMERALSRRFTDDGITKDTVALGGGARQRRRRQGRPETLSP